MNLNAAEKNALNALDVLLQLSKVRVTRRTLREKLWHHPDFPSLASLSETLDEFNVTHLATRLTPDRLLEIPLPAIAFLETNGGLLAPIRSISTHTVEWLHTKRGWQHEPLADFLTKWNGVTLLVEPDYNAGEKNYSSKRRAEILNSLRIPFAVLGGLFCMAMLLWLKVGQFNTVSFSLLGLKTIGLVVSTLLMWYSLDADNSILRSICQLNSKTNCGSILRSKVAYVYGGLSWSEMGLFYFGGGLLTLCFSPATAREGLISPLWGVGGAALLYTVYSLYHQAFIARKWCVLCLAVQALFVLEVAFGLWSEVPFDLPQSLETWAMFGVAYLVIPISWVLMKPALVRATQTDLLIRTVQRMKFTPQYLRAIATQQRVLPPIFDGMKVIHVGNPDAENTLILVTTPTCAACRRNHQLFQNLVKERNDIQGYIIFAANAADKNDEAVKVARAILNLPPSEMAPALDRWFDAENNSYTAWSHALPITEDNIESGRQLSLHLRWCELAGVMSTPTIFLNTVELPHEYSISELGKLINHFSPQGFDQITIN